MLQFLELDLASGLQTAAENIGVKITVGDKAGNTFELNVPADQIQLDVTADADGFEGLVRGTVSEDIFTGISALEKGTFTAKIEGLDSDIAARTTYLLTDAQYGANLKLVYDAAAQTLTAADGQTEFVFDKFDASHAVIALDGTILEGTAYTGSG